MIPENELFLICSRKDLTSEHQEAVMKLCSQKEIKWETVYSTALRHQVAPLIDYNLSKCNQAELIIPQSTITKFKSTSIEHNSHRQNQIHKIINILSHFRKKSVEIMLVKGAALSLTVYQNSPWYVIGDLDIILNNKKEDVSEQEDREDVDFFKNLNEREWERYQHHDINMNNILPIDFQKIWERAIPIEVDGYKVWVMSPEDMLLAACINSCRKRFFRLKSLLDIAEIINHYRELNWDEFIHNAKEYQCQNIVYTSLLVTSMTVGCRLAEKVLDNLGINPLRARVLRHLIDYLRNNILLSELLPSSGMNILGRKINPSLVLTFATYSRFQLFRKIGRLLAL